MFIDYAKIHLKPGVAARRDIRTLLRMS